MLASDGAETLVTAPPPPSMMGSEETIMEDEIPAQAAAEPDDGSDAVCAGQSAGLAFMAALPPFGHGVAVFAFMAALPPFGHGGAVFAVLEVAPCACDDRVEPVKAGTCRKGGKAAVISGGFPAVIE